MPLVAMYSAENLYRNSHDIYEQAPNADIARILSVPALIHVCKSVDNLLLSTIADDTSEQRHAHTSKQVLNMDITQFSEVAQIYECVPNVNFSQIRLTTTRNKSVLFFSL